MRSIHDTCTDRPMTPVMLVLVCGVVIVVVAIIAVLEFVGESHIQEAKNLES